MPRKQPQLAKLTRPRLYKAVARERLFRLLDQKREHPVVWIVGPPGAGKTTLAASYLEEAGLPAIWYQLDASDSDPATFFYYLKRAVDHASKGRGKPLPLLTSEYLSDLPLFARQFLRDTFARLPQEIVLVLDNYQELSADSSLHASLAAALMEVSQGASVVIVSRADPPSTHASLVVNRLITVLNWQDLQLTLEETSLVAGSAGVTDRQTLRMLHERSGGWMAGLTLMLENARGELRSATQPLETPDMLFDYFAGLIFRNAEPGIRDVLIRTSFLPWINARLAEVATGAEDAIQYVEDLHRRHLFTDRRMGADRTYQYHALFRAFLQERSRVELSLAETKSLQSRIAAELSSVQHFAEAFALYVEAQNWLGAENVILVSAESLARQGRWRTLAEWIASLPHESASVNPWIGYWNGRSATYLKPSSVEGALDSTYRAFLERGDQIGQLLVATTILEGIYFSFQDLKPMDPWIDRVVALLKAGVRAPAMEDDLRAHSAIMIGATLRAPMHSMLEECLRRVVELLKEPFEPNLKISTASMLLAYSNVAMDCAAERVAAGVARPLLQSKDVSPIRALFYLTAEGYTHYIRGRHMEALRCFDTADALVAEHGISDVNVVSTTHGRALCERRAGRIDEAEATLRRAEALPLEATGHHRGRLFLMRSVLAFDRGRHREALEYGLRSYEIYDDSGFFNGVITVGTVLANMAIVADRFDMVRRILDRLRQESYGAIAQNYLAAIFLNLAWLEHKQKNLAGRDVLLREALNRASVDGARIRFHWYVNALSELLPVAISLDIERPMAIDLAKEFGVVPVPLDVEGWPWPVRVRTLGAFELLIDDRPPKYSRKVPKKVLALLKAIIAFGGSNVPENRLVDVLWPHNDGDTARRSLTAALHRLRSLLSHRDAILHVESRLTLNPECCWIDAMAAVRSADNVVGPDEVDPFLVLYRGTFLEQEEDAHWILPMRENLRARFIHAVSKRGELLEARFEYEEAANIYQRGIDADNLVEPFYQGLMRCLDRLDRKAEAAAAYRRLRQILSVTLGVAPSPESQRMFDSVRTN